MVTPPEKLTTTEWAREHRRLSAKASARPGRYNPDLTPWVKYIHEALDDPKVHKVVCPKSAQVAWTDGVINNYIGKRIDNDPCPMIVMFAKEGAAKEYNDEKFVPMVEVTPRLSAILPVHKKRDRDNRWQFKSFPGGFLKFVASNSPSSVKSTPAPVVIVEEPDDCNTNVKEQGDTITILEERTKTYPRRKVIFGGTPTIKGLSRIEAAYLGSDQREFMVPCHHCGEAHVLAWENVTWQKDPSRRREVFGDNLPETAAYVCPHCGGLWDDVEKNRNVRKLYPVAKAEFNGVAGFRIWELYSPFPGSKMSILVTKLLTAEHALEQGDDTKMRSFVNNTLGLGYAYQSGLPEVDALKERAEEYDELTVRMGGWVVTIGIDVQHDRVAIIVRAWGVGEESWLLYWGELHGQVITPDEGVWPDLEAFVKRSFAHEAGGALKAESISIDSSDGQTADAVYAFVRKLRRVGVPIRAVKGASLDDGREIFAPPRPSVDTDHKNKAHKYGLKPYSVGTQRAKDLILGADKRAGRIKLTGDGPGRMHWYKTVRPDYWEQLLSEVKAPHRTIRNKLVWQKKSGVRNEALDCEVYALHAARALKLHLWNEDRWAEAERKVRQADLLSGPTAAISDEGGDPPSGVAGPPQQAPAPTQSNQPAVSGLFNGWNNGWAKKW